MNVVVTCFLYGSLLLYMVTGGADFGAGVAELVTPGDGKSHIRALMRKLTSPIWEADHMWLILAAVILFVGFPDIYAQISTVLFIPLTIVLLGIVGRGTSYAFRNADNVQDRFKKTDNFIYVTSSVVTPFFLGVIAGTLLSWNKPDNDSFLSVYIYSWFNYFSLSTGFLTVMFCGYLAVIYTLARFPAERERLKFQFRFLSIMFYASIPLVVSSPAFSRILPSRFIGIPVPIIIILLTAVVLYVMWRLVYSSHSKWARLFVLIPILFLILVLISNNDSSVNPEGLHFPLHTNSDYSKSIDALGLALIFGSLLIVPALCYLLYKFELPQNKEPEATD